jgi:hypothetical protein
VFLVAVVAGFVVGVHHGGGVGRRHVEDRPAGPQPVADGAHDENP